MDVSLEYSGVCVVNATSRVVGKAKVTSDAETLSKFFRELGLLHVRSRLEAGPLPPWLHGGSVAVGLPAIVIETHHVKTAHSAMWVKTDRDDACGTVPRKGMGWFWPVHAKAPGFEEVRTLLTAHAAADRASEGGIPGNLRGFEPKAGVTGNAGCNSSVRPCHRATEAEAHCGRDAEACGRSMARCVANCSSGCRTMRFAVR